MEVNVSLNGVNTGMERMRKGADKGGTNRVKDGSGKG